MASKRHIPSEPDEWQPDAQRPQRNRPQEPFQGQEQQETFTSKQLQLACVNVPKPALNGSEQYKLQQFPD